MISEEQKNKIINYLRLKYPGEHISVSFRRDKNIFIDKIHNSYYKYNFVNNELVLARVIVLPVGKIGIILGGNNLKSVNTHNIKTNKGKIVNSKRVIAVLGFTAAVLISATRSYEKDKIFEPPEVIMVDDFAYEEPKEDIVSVVDTALDDEKKSVEEFDGVVHIPVVYQGSKEANIERRLETDAMYGDIILYYTERYGLPYSLTAALFTQERYYLDNTSSKDKKNIGSLTSINCEKIIAPVMENGIVTDYDKLYVLPESYDRFKLEDLHSMIYDKRDLKEDLVYIKEADKLQSEGYQIYANSDIYNVENNIKISCAYLRYLVDKKHDLIKGYMSYNVGLNRIDDTTTYDTILSGQIKTNNNGDVYYLNHVAQYILSEEEGSDLTINFTDGTSQTLSIAKEDNLELGATLK